MRVKPSISVVGPGRLGRALSESLIKAGYTVREIVFPNARSLAENARKLSSKLRSRATTLEQARFDSDIIWLCVPDSQLEPVSGSLQSVASWKGKVVLHSSGAITSDALLALRKCGASVGSAHPLMTFVHCSQPKLKCVPFALEGDQAALRTVRAIIKGLGGETFNVRKQNKAKYHAWATMLSPLLLSFLMTAEQVARATGISARDSRQKMLPMVRQTLSNYVTIGPEAAFSGPLIRGDMDVIGQHLKALKGIPEAREVYIALAKSALHHLPVNNRKKLEKLLKAN